MAISHSANLASLVGLKSIKITKGNYPECSFLNMPFQDNYFDFCFSDQVLEHVEGNPYKAFEESIRVVKSGGFIIHTTCFVNQFHADPGDFWRFTPDALKLMSETCGATVIDCQVGEIRRSGLILIWVIELPKFQKIPRTQFIN